MLDYNLSEGDGIGDIDRWDCAGKKVGNEDGWTGVEMNREVDFLVFKDLMKEIDEDRVGIIADSHGCPERIAAAGAYLRGQGCRTIVHLGDIGDTSCLKTVDACVALLEGLQVKAVKGNNDHIIAKYHAEHTEVDLAERSLSYLRDLPLKRILGKAIFVHSLPFIQELGLSAMIRSLDEAAIRRFFDHYPDRILFRGHSHEPEIRVVDREGDRSLPFSQDEIIDLSDRLPCIVTCGALTLGYCMVWYPKNSCLRCHRLTDAMT